MKVKQFYLLLFVLFTFSLAQPHQALAQETEEEISIYLQALEKYAEWITRFEKQTDTLYFEELRGITTLFPKEIKGLTVVVLNGRNQREVYNAHDNELIQRKMTPARVSGKEIEIGIIPYQGRLDPQRGVVLSLSKWFAVIFQYSPKAERFVYVRFENR